MSSPSDFSNLPLDEYEKRVRNHGLLAAIAFLVLMPIGVFIPRYLRTFTNRWWWSHWMVNFLISGPVVFAAWAMAGRANNLSQAPLDGHKKLGYAIFSLYIVQSMLGLFIHFVRIPFLFVGHRPPQNYIHALLGLTILAMANYQVHNGIYTEWPLMTGNVHPVKEAGKHAWLALVIIFWTLYAIGLAFLPRQYRQEREGRLLKQDKEAL
ncbi:hypothetical protein B0F90DRAFT_1811833 [Multifurca ochricompacta]|uniref:Cytochrome b561 domain-containing protein n=1 Tax=Multifurca ochricompacta TaxID=376703 RepID=A0AAD4LXI9_9AGAM|nr:hypothetical protein B0F90DRAFT_1811833 [Multifurca ochricompacta]